LALVGDVQDVELFFHQADAAVAIGAIAARETLGQIGRPAAAFAALAVGAFVAADRVLAVGRRAAAAAALAVRTAVTVLALRAEVAAVTVLAVFAVVALGVVEAAREGLSQARELGGELGFCHAARDYNPVRARGRRRAI